MTTGINDFIMTSGFHIPIAAIPAPALNVPYPAPMSKNR